MSVPGWGDMNVLEWGGRSVGFVRVGWKEECGCVRVVGGGERAESVPE